MIGLFVYYFFLFVASSFFNLFLKKKVVVNLTFFVICFLIIFLPYFIINKGIRDIELFESVGFYSSQRIDIYYIDSNHGLYPYFPFLSIVMAPVYIISQLTSLSFINIWRLIALVSLLLSSYFIYRILEFKKNRDSLSKIIFFLFSPVALFPTVFHSHFDIILILFLLISVYIVFIKKSNSVYGPVFFGLSVLAKTWSIMFLPLFVFKNNLKIKGYFLIPFSLVIIGLTAFYVRVWHSSFTRISEAVLGYTGGGDGKWGFFGILNLLSGNSILFGRELGRNYLIILILIIYLIIFLKKFDAIKSILFLILSLFIFNLGIAVQYIFWIWPFIILSQKNSVIRLYSFLSAPYLFLTYASLVWNIKNDVLLVFSSLPIWLFNVKLWYTLLREK